MTTDGLRGWCAHETRLTTMGCAACHRRVDVGMTYFPKGQRPGAEVWTLQLCLGCVSDLGRALVRYSDALERMDGRRPLPPRQRRARR